MTTAHISSYELPLSNDFLQQILDNENYFSYDLVTVRSITQNISSDNKQLPSSIDYFQQNKLNDVNMTDNRSNENLFINHRLSELLTSISKRFYENQKTLETDKIFFPHNFILLDRFTPLTIGSIVTNEK